jgi:predicted Zn-dependent protease
MRVLSAWVVLALGLSGSAGAQIHNGRITGTIVDDAGQPIHGAVVVADNRQATPPTRTSVSNEDGRFGLMGLRSGVWSLLVRAQGHEPVTRTEAVQGQRPGPPITIALARIPGAARMTTFGALKPATVVSDLDRAAKLVEERKLDDAIVIYRSVLERAPALTSVQLALARAYRAKPDLPKAREVSERLLASEPGNVRARLELALTLEQAGDMPAAVRELEQIVRDAPDSTTGVAAREKLTVLGRSSPNR